METNREPKVFPKDKVNVMKNVFTDVMTVFNYKTLHVGRCYRVYANMHRDNEGNATPHPTDQYEHAFDGVLVKVFYDEVWFACVSELDEDDRDCESDYYAIKRIPLAVFRNGEYFFEPLMTKDEAQ